MRKKISLKVPFGTGVVLVLLTVACFGAQPPHPAPRMTYLDNGEVRIGMDLALGGAVTYISSKDHPGNIINSADLERQIQIGKYDAKKSLHLELKPDGKFHAYHLDLGSLPEYRGLITGLAIEPVRQPSPGEEMAIRSIVLSTSSK
jgi:hypothetical protein